MNRPNGINLVYATEQFPPITQQETEINLIDVWTSLVNQKKIILQTVIICLALSSAYLLLKQPRYYVSSVVQIGSLQKEDMSPPVPIELTKDVMEKIKSAYIPFVISQYKQKNADKSIIYDIEASVPKDTNIISLKTSCKPGDVSICRQLIDSVVTKIIADHSNVVGLSKKELEVKLASAENELTSRKDEIKYIAAKKQRLLKTSELLSGQLKEKKLLLASALKNRSKIAANNAVGAMLALQIDNEIKRNQELIDALEQRLTIGLNQEHDDLDKALRNNAISQSEQENKIEQIKNKMLNINNTKAVVPTLMADKPEGVGSTFILLSAAFVGLTLGLFAAFFREFLIRAKVINDQKAAI